MKARSKERGNGFQPFSSPQKLCAIFAVLAVLSLGIVIAADGSNESSADMEFDLNYDYDTTNKTATVTGYSDGSGALVIPATTINPDDPIEPYAVTGIWNGVFRGHESLISLDLGSVTSVGAYAFADCINLISLDMDSVTSIGTAVFLGCNSLTSVSIPSSVVSMGASVFQDCKSLTSVSIPSSVTFMGAGMFSDCISLTSVSIPGSIDSISSATFRGCISLASVSIPDPIGSIGSSAFDGCTSLASVSIPSSVTSIGGYAFNGCTSLPVIAVSDAMSVSSMAFSGQIVYYNGIDVATAYYASGDSSVSVMTPVPSQVISLVDSSSANVPFSGSVDTWRFKFPSSGNFVTMSFNTLPDIMIYTVNDLKNIGVDPTWTMGRSYILANDITFTTGDGKFTPIGTPIAPFTGSFNGNGNAIFAIDVDTVSSAGAAGLFGYVGSNARIFDLTLSGKVVAGNQSAGGIAGVTQSGSVTITNCHSYDLIVTSGCVSGGIVGTAGPGTTIYGCTSSRNVTSGGVGGAEVTATTGYACAGGIVGFVDGTSSSPVTVSDCSNSVMAMATAANNMSGGIAGFARHMIATNCTNTGGIQGVNAYYDGSTIYVGGIAGRIESSSLTDCTNGSSGNVGVTTKSNASPGGSIRYWLGGMTGSMADGSSIEGCTNEGLVFARAMGNTSDVYLGGLVGCMYKGTSAVDCKNTRAISANNNAIPGLIIYTGGIAGVATGTSSSGVTITNCDSTPVTESAVSATAENVRVGGILGYGKYVTLFGCDSSGIIAGIGGATQFITGGSVRSGGVAGYLEYSSLTACSNSGAVQGTTTTANAIVESGGIVGRATGAITIASCSNTGDVTVQGDFGYAYAGGMAGFLAGILVDNDGDGNADTVMVSSGSNTAAVGAIAPNSRSGGMAGFASNTVATTFDNSGSVTGGSTFDSGSTVYVGGIAGRLESSILTGCTNASTGNVGIASTPNTGDNGSFRYWLGGIAGDMIYGSSVSGASNSATVGATVPKGTTYLYIGGIVGSMYQGTSVGSSKNSGSVSGGSDSVSGLFVYAGGVAGAAMGALSSESPNLPVEASITNCGSLTSSPVTVTVTAVNARAGGVLGYGLYANVSDCEFDGAVVGAGGSVQYGISGASVRSGGIAGYLEHSSLTRCTSSGSVSAMTLNSNGLPRAGGIVGSMVMGTTLSDSMAYGSVTASAGIMTTGKSYAGGIAGLTEGTISGCTYASSASRGTVMSVGFTSGAGGLAGTVNSGTVAGVAYADVTAEYAETIGKGRAGVGAGYALSTTTVTSTGSVVTPTIKPVLPSP